MIFREDDVRYLTALDEVLADEGIEDAEDDEDDDELDDDSNDADVDMASGDANELIITRKCDGILDIVLVGEVRSSSSCISLSPLFTRSFSLAITPPRRTFATVKLGITTNSTVASANGMDSLRSSVFP
jgi:hypothetical protein